MEQSQQHPRENTRTAVGQHLSGGSTLLTLRSCSVQSACPTYPGTPIRWQEIVTCAQDSVESCRTWMLSSFSKLHMLQPPPPTGATLPHAQRSLLMRQVYLSLSFCNFSLYSFVLSLARLAGSPMGTSFSSWWRASPRHNPLWFFTGVLSSQHVRRSHTNPRSSTSQLRP